MILRPEVMILSYKIVCMALLFALKTAFSGKTLIIKSELANTNMKNRWRQQ